MKTDALTRGIKRIHAEGQGVLRFELIDQRQVPDLLRAVAGGDPYALRAAALICQFLEQMARAKPSLLCLLCDRELTAAAPPAVIALISALRDSPRGAIVNGLCRECAQHPDRGTLSLAKYREWMIPDLKLLPPLSPPGHA